MAQTRPMSDFAFYAITHLDKPGPNLGHDEISAREMVLQSLARQVRPRPSPGFHAE